MDVYNQDTFLLDIHAYDYSMGNWELMPSVSAGLIRNFT